MSAATTIGFRFGRIDLEPARGVSFKSVTDVAANAVGELFVLTRGEGTVVVHDGGGAFLRSFGHFIHAHGLTIDAEGRVCVVDEGDHTVRVHSPDGVEVGVVGNSGQPSDSGCDWSRPTYKEKYLSVVRGAGPFNRPTSLAFATDGSYFVADGYANSRVHHFDRDGALIRSWGEPGSAPGQFRLPHGVCVLPDGDVLVADRENDRVQRFTYDGEHRETWEGIQRPSKPIVTSTGHVVIGELGRPIGDYSFAAGEIVEELPPRVAVFDPSGQLLGRSVIEPRPTGEPSSPHGLAEGPDGLIYIGELAPPSGTPVTTLLTLTITT